MSRDCRSVRLAAFSRRRRFKSQAMRAVGQVLPHEPWRASRSRYEHVLRRGGRRARASHQLGGPDDWAANLENNTLIADQIEERAKVRVSLAAGPHEITAAWLKKSDAVDPVRTTRPVRSSHDTRDPLGIPHLSTFTIAGPSNRLVRAICRVDAESSRANRPGVEERCARRIIATLVRRAYRGQGTTPTSSG